MDETLPISLEDATTLFLRSLGVLIINAWANVMSVIIALPTILSFFVIRQYYIKTAREIKRLEGVMRNGPKYIFLILIFPSENFNRILYSLTIVTLQIVTHTQKVSLFLP